MEEARLLGCTDRRVAPGIRRTRAAAAGAGGADCCRQDPCRRRSAALTAPNWGGLAAPPGPVIRQAYGPLDAARPALVASHLCVGPGPTATFGLGTGCPRPQAYGPGPIASYGVRGLRPPHHAAAWVRSLPTASGLGVPGLKHTGWTRSLNGVRGLRPPPHAAGRARSLSTASGLGVSGLKHTGRARSFSTAPGALDPHLARRTGSARYLRPPD